MNRCDFVVTPTPGVYRCRRCGAERASAHSPDRVHRWCDVIDLASASPAPAADRGLGDTVARVIDAVTWGQGERLAQTVASQIGLADCGCDRRREWLNRALPYAPALKPPISGRGFEHAAGSAPLSLLLRMPHGLGDAVQLSVVLKHLRHYRPEWAVDVAAKVGAHTMFAGLCRRAFVWGEEPAEQDYTVARTLAWDEPVGCYFDSPATKAEHCLHDVFQLQPIEALCRYQVAVSQAAQDRARAYLGSLAEPVGERFPVVLFHYQGNSAVERKTLDEELVAGLAQQTIERGLTPVVLDWDERSQLRFLAGVHCPGATHPLWRGTGTGDGETIAALIQQSTAMLAIDSGPGHIAGATDTPTLLVWTGHHPLQFYELAPHVRHAVPTNHHQLLRGAQAAALDYFERKYRYRRYADLRRALPLMFDELLDAAALPPSACDQQWTVDADLWIRQDHLAADRTIVNDVYLDDCYQVDRLPWQPRLVVDLGAQLGAFARRIERRLAAGAKVICVEPDPVNLPLLRRNASAFATIVPAACTYAQWPTRLRSSIYPGTDNTGGSALAETGQVVASVTLEEIVARHQLPWIDVLKLDCEGCECELLECATVFDRVRLIVGEWHDRERFLGIVSRRFADWELRILREGELGLFWLTNPRDVGAADISTA